MLNGTGNETFTHTNYLFFFALDLYKWSYFDTKNTIKIKVLNK